MFRAPRELISQSVETRLVHRVRMAQHVMQPRLLARQADTEVEQTALNVLLELTSRSQVTMHAQHVQQELIKRYPDKLAA